MRWSRIIGLMVLTLVLIPSFGTALADDTLTVSTVKDSYNLGDDVTVKGYTSIDETVTVVIGNSSKDIFTLTDDPNKNGNYKVEYILNKSFEIGEYNVNATVGDLWEITTFKVVTDDGDGACEDFETVDDLLCALERALDYLKKVNDTTTALQDDYDMTFFWEHVEELNKSLTDLYDDAMSEIWETSAEDLIDKFCDIRKEISQLNGLLNSITKNVKAKKAQQFTMNMMRHINRIKTRIGNLESSENSERFANDIEAHKRILNRLNMTLHTTISAEELETILDDLQGVSEGVESGLNDLSEEGLSLKALYKLQAKIDVFRATVERMEEKSKHMNRLEEKLGKADELTKELREKLGMAEELMEGLLNDWNGKNWGKVKEGIAESNDNLGGVGKTIRELNKPDKSNKGGNGKGKNKGN